MRSGIDQRGRSFPASEAHNTTFEAHKGKERTGHVLDCKRPSRQQVRDWHTHVSRYCTCTAYIRVYQPLWLLLPGTEKLCRAHVGDGGDAVQPRGGPCPVRRRAHRGVLLKMRCHLRGTSAGCYNRDTAPEACLSRQVPNNTVREKRAPESMVVMSSRPTESNTRPRVICAVKP